MNTPSQDREFDVVVLGASGFTGTLVAEYLCRQYGVDKELKWAIAGRNEKKLDDLRANLGDGAEILQTITADSHDRESLLQLVARTRVVLTTVGPYALYGSELVDACVESGTHYCDLAGEVQWIRKMIDRHQQRAEQTGARIVNCCGFDSVPMDIGVWFLQEKAHEKFGQYCKSITMLVRAMKGTASGGTLASMMNILAESSKDKEVARILVDPYSLNPDGERNGPDGRDQQRTIYNYDADSWTAPFVMALVNSRVVRRSHALAGYPYGKDFRYHEAVSTGPGIAGRLKGIGITVGLGSVMTAGSFDMTRALMQKFIASPGEGPDRELQESGFFNLMQIGKMADGSIIRTRISGDQDPGYGSTSKMLSECAVCLAKDDLDSAGGILTPASAMARPLLERLQQNAGLTFELRD